MAVRNTNAYLFESMRLVLGASAPPSVLKNDYPLDSYSKDVVLKEGAKSYMSALDGHMESTDYDISKAYHVNGRKKTYSGKRDFACRVGRWSSLPESVAQSLYISFDSTMENRDMGLILGYIGCKSIHGDCKGSFKLLQQLSQEPYSPREKTIVLAASAVARFASLYTSPSYLAVPDPHYASLESVCSAETAFAHFLHMEMRLTKLLLLCKRVGRARSAYGLRTRLAKMIASHKWFNSEDEDEVVDAYLSMAVNSSIAEPLGDLEDRMDEYDDAGDYDKSDACIELMGKVRVAAEEIKEVGSKVMPVPIGGADSSFVTRDGLLMVFSGEGYIQSTKDIGLCIELVQEAMSSLADLLTTKGTACGQSYHKAILALWSSASQLSPDEANFMSCAHRDYELSVKQVDIKAFDRSGIFVTVGSCNRELAAYSKDCAKVVSKYMSMIPPGITSYHWARSMRCLPLCRFSIPLLVSETKRVYDITHEPDDEELDRLSSAIVLQLALCYKARHGVSPSGFDEIVSQLDEDTSLSKMIDAMAGWDYKGVAKFDDKATIARDKSNIPASSDILTSAKAYNNASANLRREILYFEDNDKDRETAAAVRFFKAGAKGSVKAHVGVKPESKEGGRAVTSERSDIRKGNTTITNNLLPYVDQIQGSLMAASPAKKERSVHDMVKDGRDLADYISYFLATDFVKFGHSLSCKLQRVVFKVVSIFFDRPWIANVPDMLPNQEVCCVYGDHFASFINTTGGDGQGMRNAVWQLMLAGCLVFVNSELGGQVENVRSEKPLSLLYFMDDHLFRTLVKHTGPTVVRNRVAKGLMSKLNSIEDSICKAYNKIGLGTNEEKNTRSLHGAILTGMHISDRGRENVPGRAIQRSFVETSHRAPSIVDVVSNVAGSCVGAIEDGRDRASSMAVSLFLSSLKVSQMLTAACKRNASLIGALLVTPVCMGGMGHPIEPDIVVQSGPNSYDDHLYNLFFHLANKTKMTGAAASIYQTLKMSGKSKLKDCGGTFTARHNKFLEPPSSTIKRYLRKTRLAVRFEKLEGMRKHLDLCLDYLESSYNVIPATVAKAVVDAHPYTVAASELDRVVSSATSVMLMGHESLQSAKRSSTHRSMMYLNKASRLSSPGTNKLKDIRWDTFVWEFGQSCKTVSMETPPRGPKYAMVLPCNTGVPDLEARSIPATDTFAIIEPGSNATSVSRGAELWCSMERAAVNTAADLLVMSNSCPEGEAIGSVVCSMYGRVNLEKLLIVEEVSDPFRSLPSVQYCPQTTGFGVRKELQTDYVTAESMVSVRSSMSPGRKAHVNHGAAMVVALVASKCCRSFVLSDLACWVEPTLVRSGKETRRPMLMVTGPKVAIAMVAALEGTLTSARIELFRDFKSDALEIYSYMARSVAINRRLCTIERQAPVMPSGARTHYIDPVATAVRSEKPSQQADAVLKILAIQVIGRVSVSTSAEQCLGIIASAQARLSNYLGELPENDKWVKMLVPSVAEAGEAFEVCKKAGIIQPMMYTLNRYYRSAKHADMSSVDRATPKAFQTYAKGAYKSWHRLLHCNIGELCSLEASYDDTDNYYKSAMYWSARHKRHYVDMAEQAKAAKAQERSVPVVTYSELLSYEIKSKVMSKLAQMAISSCDKEAALNAALFTVHNVYSRATAKRLGNSADTISRMYNKLVRAGEKDTAAAIAMSTKKAAVMLKMVSCDLHLSIRTPRRNHTTKDVSLIVGAHTASGHDRNWAESGDTTTSAWVKFYKITSAFGTSLSPILDYAYIGRESNSIASPFDSSTQGSIRLKSRTKVRYTDLSEDGSSVARQSHLRTGYGSETHAGRRHGVNMSADPSDMAILRDRMPNMSPLTLPSLPNEMPTDINLQPPTNNETVPALPTSRTQNNSVSLAERQETRTSTRRARVAGNMTLNLANAPDWTDLS